MLFKRLEPNTKGRDFVVGDVHGQFKQLREAMATVEFKASKDRLIFLGDLIDRGERSHEALSWLQEPWTESIKGNHEMMLEMGYMAANEIEGCEQWMANCWMSPAGAGQWALYLFDELCADEFKEWYDTMKELPLMMEMDVDGKKVGFIHAEIPNGVLWEEAKSVIIQDAPDDERSITECISWSKSRYQRYNMIKNHFDGMAGVYDNLVEQSTMPDVHCVFQGHTPLAKDDNYPLVIGNQVYLDTSVDALVNKVPFKLVNLQEFIKNFKI